MTLRRRLAALVLASAVAAAPTTCSVPAHADPEIPTVPAEAAWIDGEWVRVMCDGTTAKLRCVLRFPEGFRRLDVAYYHSRDYGGTLTTYTDEPGRPRQDVRRFDRLIVSGVRVSCETVGARVDCDIRIREAVRDYRDTYYSAGSHQGGLIWQIDR